MYMYIYMNTIKNQNEQHDGNAAINTAFRNSFPRHFLNQYLPTSNKCNLTVYYKH